MFGVFFNIKGQEVTNEANVRRGSLAGSDASAKLRQCNNNSITPWKYDTDPSQVFLSPHTGRVGIGTCSPLAKTHIIGGYNYDNLFMVGTVTYELPSLPLVRNHFVIKNSGQVGIGTIDPQARLHVMNYLKVGYRDKKADKDWDVINSDGKYIYQEAGLPMRINYKKNKPVTFGSGNINVSVQGKLGIGTTNPVSSLEVVKSPGVPALIVRDNNPASSIVFNPAQSSHLIGYYQLDFWEIDNNWGIPVMTLNDKRVGIGTQHPQKSLHIFGTGVQMRVGDNNNLLDVGTDGANGIVEYSGPHKLLINYYNNKPVAIGGNLGIGGLVSIGTSPDPQYSLNVCGKIHGQEVVVDPPGWCDFVFEPDYKLMSWDSLMNYIGEHKHLPGVPSEKEVETAGVPVGEMSKILLQKVEELVLYNDQLRKEVKELREEVARLKKERNSGEGK